MCQFFPLACKTVYRWDATNCCFMSDMVKIFLRLISRYLYYTNIRGWCKECLEVVFQTLKFFNKSLFKVLFQNTNHKKWTAQEVLIWCEIKASCAFCPPGKVPFLWTWSLLMRRRSICPYAWIDTIYESGSVKIFTTHLSMKAIIPKLNVLRQCYEKIERPFLLGEIPRNVRQVAEYCFDITGATRGFHTELH